MSDNFNTKYEAKLIEVKNYTYVSETFTVDNILRQTMFEIYIKFMYINRESEKVTKMQRMNDLISLMKNLYKSCEILC